MINTIDYDDLKKLIDKYIAKGGACYVIDGCLLDNYVLVGEKLKTIVIKEMYLNEWSSTSTIRTYNRTPKKYEKVVELLDNSEYDKASNLFFS